MSKEANKHVAAGIIGNVLEWFDYGLYGYFAVIISANFFPNDDPMASLILSFMVFGLGFIARPVGGVIFGRLGDKIGRKDMLSLTVIMMGGSTFVMGLLPTYQAIGIAAPILLTTARLIQGIACGGEWGNAVAFLGEYAKPNNRAFIVGFSQMGTATGLLLGALTGWLFNNIMTQEALYSYGWRIAFLLGIVIAFFGYYMRKGIEETPVFQGTEKVEAPVREVFKNHTGTMIRHFFLAATGHLTYWLIFSYMVTYVNVFLKLPMKTGFSLTAVTLLAYIIALPFFCSLADKFGRKPIMMVGGGGILLLGYPLFSVLAKITSFGSMTLVVSILAILFAAWNGPIMSLMNELYPTKVRVTGFSIPYQITSALFGGTAAMVATWLVSATGNVMAMPLYILAVMAMSLFTLIFFIPETKNVDYDA